MVKYLSRQIVKWFKLSWPKLELTELETKLKLRLTV